jgi:hypothetical protein
MEWFKQKTSIAGVQVSNWMIVLGALTSTPIRRDQGQRINSERYRQVSWKIL